VKRVPDADDLLGVYKKGGEGKQEAWCHKPQLLGTGLSGGEFDFVLLFRSANERVKVKDVVTVRELQTSL
jgi:hypothetical protein